MPSVIELQDLHRIYDSGAVPVHAVRGISLSIDAGESVAIIGASGSGKSSLMNLIGCLDRPTRGRYCLDGSDVSLLDRDALADLRNRKIGFVFQGFNLLARTTALENVELPLLCSRSRSPSTVVRQRARNCLKQVGLAERENHFPTQLSGGQQQRVAIARALANRPEIILADEPTGNLDSQTSLEIMAVFGELNAAGITLIMVTHDASIAAHCGRVLTLLDGRLVNDERGS